MRNEEVVSRSPNNESKSKKSGPSCLSTNTTRNAGEIERIPKDDRSKNLTEPIEQVVQSTSSDVEDSAVHSVLLVGVEDVRAEKHGEEQEDPRLFGEGIPETLKFSSPRWILHKDNLRVVLADDFVTIDEETRDHKANKHENDKRSVGTVINLASVIVQVLK